MILTKRSPVSRLPESIPLPYEPAEYGRRELSRIIGKNPIEAVYPELASDEHEFILTGIRSNRLGKFKIPS
jgi:hypothetical protein